MKRSIESTAPRWQCIPALICICLAGCGADTGSSGAAAGDEFFTDAAQTAAAVIDADTIRRVTVELSDDRYEGRAPGTAGDIATRRYLAEELAAIGFQPGAADGSWEQPFELVSVTARPPATWTFATGRSAVAFTRQSDFVVASGVQATEAAVENAELVFVGYGIQAPEYDWDDYKGIDVRGKVLVMLNNDPDWDPNLFEGITRLYYGRWSYKYEIAAELGALGAIIIHTTPSAGYPWQVVQTSWSGAQFELPDSGEPRMQFEAWLTEDAAARLFDASGQDLEVLLEAARSPDFEPVELNARTSLSMPVAVTATSTANVIGVLRGSDPALAGEYVIYTAHHDHLGIGEPNPNGDPEDRIYNGARDNASGVGMLISIGRAFAAMDTPPRRSVMLLFVGAEEQGLLGSAFYADHPTVPPGKIAANVNFDSANIWGRARDMVFVGYGKSSLDAVAERVAAYQNRIVEPDEFPDRGYYYRSDQFSFAKIGVPAFYLDGGSDIVGQPEGWGVDRINEYTELHYHQPSDEYDDSWNFDGIVEDARFGFWAGLIVANTQALPAWNAGDEFEAARQAALEAL
ncbi:MAG: M28 family peptidase [Gammaproteobacteria bacterium]|jgi:Zn-dependent M28 family amino/carboxypeptidase